MFVGVVRRVDLKILVGKLWLRLAEGVLNRGIDLQRHALTEPVPDDGGNEGALLRYPRLTLDHGGDDHDVVLRELCATSTREVDLGERRVKRGELLLNESPRRDALRKIVPRGKEHTLQARATRIPLERTARRVGGGGRDVVARPYAGGGRPDELRRLLHGGTLRNRHLSEGR